MRYALLAMFPLLFQPLFVVKTSATFISVPANNKDNHQLSQSGWYTAALQHLQQQWGTGNTKTVLNGTGQAEANFGASVASAGDVNGDGFADVIIGAPWFDSTDRNEGRAYIYYGTASGLPVVPAVTLSYHSNPDGNENFGASVAGAGDVNGDGYADIIVGAPYASDIGYEAALGQALVYYGSAAGIHTTADMVFKGDMPFAFFGESVAGAGDINGDGYPDVIIGAGEYGYTGNYPNGSRGRVFVYYGSATGLPATADTYVEGTQYRDLFGRNVTGAGDINGDGYADIAVSAPGYFVYNKAPGDGAVFVYLGSAVGLTTTYAHLFTDARVYGVTGFGSSLAGGSDLNGDNYADLVIGEPRYLYLDDTGAVQSVARLLVYYGSASGFAAAPAILDHTGVPGLTLGGAASYAGDYNNDGYADLVVAGSRYDAATSTSSSNLLLYHGSATGLTATVFDTIDSARYSPGMTVAGAGDVNGDGYADIVAGEPLYAAGGNTNAGRAFVYYGAADKKPVGPLDILTFTAEKKNDDVLLQWTTAGEMTGIQYTVERSTNGNHYTDLFKTFSRRGITQYRWVDEHPIKGKNYYRIKASSGKQQKYTPVVVVDFEKPPACIIYPNPVCAGQLLYVRLSPAKGLIGLQLTDIHGRVLLQKQFTTESELFSVRMPVVPSGIYKLTIKTGNTVINKPLIIIKR